DRMVSLQTPSPDESIAMGGSQGRTISAQGQRPDRCRDRGLSERGTDRLSGRDVPDRDCTLAMTCYQSNSIPTKRRGSQQAVRWVDKWAGNLLKGAQVQDRQRIVLADGQQAAAVPVEC